MEFEPSFGLTVLFFFNIDANKYFFFLWIHAGLYRKKTGQIDLIWPDLRHFSGLKSILSRLKHLECMCMLKLLPYGMSTPNECFTGQRCQISGQNDLIWPKSAFLQSRNLYQDACSFSLLLLS